MPSDKKAMINHLIFTPERIFNNFKKKYEF